LTSLPGSESFVLRQFLFDLKDRFFARPALRPGRRASLTTKAPYKGIGAVSEEKREPASDIDTVVVDSLNALDLEWPIREADC
jgi:hypothetical protein